MTNVKFHYSYNFGRYESETKTENGYFAKFICVKIDKDEADTKGWIIKVFNGKELECSSGYEFATWAPNTLCKTAKDSIEWFNSTIENEVNCDKWSKGYLE